MDAEGLLRSLAPQALGALVRRHGHFDACEDAVQEALLAAAQQWPKAGVPEHPRGWLIAVATRRLIDEIRANQSRGAREEAAFDPEERYQPGPWGTQPGRSLASTGGTACSRPTSSPTGSG